MGSSSSLGSTNSVSKKEHCKQLSESTTSTFLDSIEDLYDGFMCISSTLALDTESKCALRPEVPDQAKKTQEDVTSQEKSAKVSFGQQVTKVEIPKYRDMPELKADLWFTNDEMLKMKLATLLKKR
jgi:hypothetical protein